MGIPNHNNIGDAAIADAEINILTNIFPNNELKLYKEEEFEDVVVNAKKEISKEDIIFIHGGGNIGNLYKWIEYGRRKVLEVFQENTIISFPETMYFTDDEDGRKELELSKKEYNKHKNLILLAREPKTYELFKEHFYNARIYLTPDIVMTQSYPSSFERSGAMLLLRYDPERAITDSTTLEIEKVINKYYPTIKKSDTTADKGISNMITKKRKEIIYNKLKEIQQSQVVITDRLHGMIFCAITRTPCIAINNFNHKISESYKKWFEKLNYIRVCNDVNNFENIVKEMQNIEIDPYDSLSKEDIITNILKTEVEI